MKALFCSTGSSARRLLSRHKIRRAGMGLGPGAISRVDYVLGF
jgi:hypothetical protein